MFRGDDDQRKRETGVIRRAPAVPFCRSAKSIDLVHPNLRRRGRERASAFECGRVCELRGFARACWHVCERYSLREPHLIVEWALC